MSKMGHVWVTMSWKELNAMTDEELLESIEEFDGHCKSWYTEGVNFSDDDNDFYSCQCLSLERALKVAAKRGLQKP